MLEILYTDPEIIVAVKPAGTESQTARRFEPDMVSELKKYLVAGRMCEAGREPYVAAVHRLDKPVCGVMVYARTKKAAAALSEQIRSGKMKKIYHAVVCGIPGNPSGNYVDYLLKDRDGNRSAVADRAANGAKRAELSYETLETTADGLSLLRIELKTGRHHQIRVQMAAHGTPVWGDRKYGPPAQDGGGADGVDRGGVCESRGGGGACGNGTGDCRRQLALCASALSFFHPKTGEQMRFSIRPSGGVFEKFSHWE